MSNQGGGSKPPLQMLPPQWEILSRRLSTTSAQPSSSALTCDAAVQRARQLSEMRLNSSFMPIAALLRTIIEHLRDRFLVPNLILVQ